MLHACHMHTRFTSDPDGFVIDGVAAVHLTIVDMQLRRIYGGLGELVIHGGSSAADGGYGGVRLLVMISSKTD